MAGLNVEGSLRHALKASDSPFGDGITPISINTGQTGMNCSSTPATERYQERLCRCGKIEIARFGQNQQIR